MTAPGGDRPDGGRLSPLPVDTLGLWEAATGLPEQLVSARGLGADAAVDGGTPSRVVLLGAGPSALAARVAAAFAARRSPVPCTVSTSFVPPVLDGPSTVVVALSWSGEAEETLAAAGTALETRARVVAITSGGALGALGASAGAARVVLPATVPASRAALGMEVAATLGVLEALGVAPGAGAALDALGAPLARRRDVLATDRAEPWHVARTIGRTFPVVHGAEGPGALAAWRWKSQVNVNAKAPASWAAAPDLDHDEIAGYGQGGDITRQILTAVLLRSRGEDPRVARRLDGVAEVLREVVADVLEVRGELDGDLGAFFELALFGDLVSLHLAGGEGIDPGPVPIERDVALGTGPAAS